MRTLLIPATLLLVAGCSSDSSRTSFLDRLPDPSDLPLVYKVDVQQGNVVTQDMLTQLKPGMEKSKVRFIMGTPLITDVFHKDRWDYFYSYSERGGRPVQRHLTVYFKDEVLSHIDGDVRVSSTLQEVPRNRDTSVVVPGQHEDSMLEKVKKSVGLGEAKKAETEAQAKTTDEYVSVPPRDEEEKGLFDRLMEKMGVGDNEDEKSYDSGDVTYKDPSNPDPNPEKR